MADAGVDIATAADLQEIVRIHRETWRLAYAELLPPEVLDTLDTDEAWALAVQQGAVLKATEGEWTVGFVVASKAPEEEVARADGSLPADAETTALVSVLVEPRWGRRGHGTRLVAEAAQRLRESGATRGIAWVPEADKASKNFYERLGWTGDGTVRTLDAGGRPLREVRVSGELAVRLDD
ncbi:MULTISPECIES: GNAT family N-acetyltransferase [Lentzea]|uniref:Ribosomal protein S18 acetylase RimI n=1 Tax=Lentzea albida TaxID=65499 RepID=A0A1H9LSI5_9PSEU|nr:MULTISPECIES: GNAT family N-acetyltransferase [Lentzea]USX51629.1 GNAT family N-acetyltransferase [Lentzea sp. HUAS12]SER14239.1 Ribosomal protein S18 acetylase RimI [Lentzea albida]